MSINFVDQANAANHYTTPPPTRVGVRSPTVRCIIKRNPINGVYRWSANDAVEYLIRVSGVSRSKAEFDVRRIVTFPGQAVAPEYGHLKITMLRRVARSTIGRMPCRRNVEEEILLCQTNNINDIKYK